MRKAFTSPDKGMKEITGTQKSLQTLSLRGMSFRSPSRKFGFTLAEVLITLGIIGVVAAMTLPALVQNYQKQAAATKVKKFYNIINNALRMSTVDHGDVHEWMVERKALTYEEGVEYLKKYFLPYLKYTKYDNCYESYVCVYLADGGMFSFWSDANGGDIYYFINGKFERNKRNEFDFEFNKINGKDEDFNPIERNKNTSLIEPYTFEWDGNIATLKTGHKRSCENSEEGAPTTFCTKLIQLNNWTIPDDYPW